MKATVQTELLERHLTDAAFLWQLRQTAVTDWAADRARLSFLDQRVEAHIDALRLAGKAGWAACLAGIDEQPGGLFASAVVAVDGHRQELDALVARAEGDGSLVAPLVSAFSWCSAKQVRGLLVAWLTHTSSVFRHVAVESLALHRIDPGNALVILIDDVDVSVRASALRAVGRLGREDLLPQIRAAVNDRQPSVRFAAAQSGALIGDPSAASALLEIVGQGGAYAIDACELAMRSNPLRVAAARLRELSARSTLAEVALAGAAALGDPSMIPWVIAQSHVPALARRAGRVFSTITGVDLLSARLATMAPEGFVAGPTDAPADANVALDADAALPWPNPEMLTAWWNAQGRAFKPGVRLFLGQTITPTVLENTLADGLQPLRAWAALELAMGETRRSFVDVGAVDIRRAADPHVPTPNHDALVITAMGVVSALGAGAVPACASARAGYARIAAIKSLDTRDTIFGPVAEDAPVLRGHLVTDVAVGFSGPGKIIELSSKAIDELLEQRPLDADLLRRTGLLINLADGFVSDVAAEPGLSEKPSEHWRRRTAEVANTLAKMKGLSGGKNVCRVHYGAHAGFAEVLRDAVSRIESRQIDRCIVGGVDSRVEPAFLAASARLRLLRTGDNPVGLIAGEGAAFFLVERAGEARAAKVTALAQIGELALERDETSLLADVQPRGIGLARALMKATGGVAPSTVLIDLNGTERRAFDWGCAQVRCPGLFDASMVHVPAMSFGDTGAAAGALALAVAVRGFVRGYAHSDAIIALSSEDGTKAAIALHRADVEEQ